MHLKEAITARQVELKRIAQDEEEARRLAALADARLTAARTLAVLQSSLTPEQYEALNLVDEINCLQPQLSRVYFPFARGMMFVRSDPWGPNRVKLYIRPETDYCGSFHLMLEGTDGVVPNLWTRLIDYLIAYANALNADGED